MNEDEIARLALLYDIGFQGIEPDEPECIAARAEFYRSVESAWKGDLPHGSVTLAEYRLKVVTACRAWLRKN
jgi:hypothetical protein